MYRGTREPTTRWRMPRSRNLGKTVCKGFHYILSVTFVYWPFFHDCPVHKYQELKSHIMSLCAVVHGSFVSPYSSSCKYELNYAHQHPPLSCPFASTDESIAKSRCGDDLPNAWPRTAKTEFPKKMYPHEFRTLPREHKTKTKTV